ncbi:zinc finger protein CONSTANS-LIKE 1 [Fagus crenata]
MYAHPNPAFSRAADSLGQSTSPANLLPLTIPLLPPNLLDQLTSEFDSVVVPESLRALNSPEVGTNNSSNCSGCSSCGSTGSLASHQTQRPSFIQRSVSSHSLLKNGFRQLVSSSTHEFVDSESGPVRRVFSTGDLQRINMVQNGHRSESPLSNENSIIIESMSRACRYSPEEKKERIERYRSKRTQRNFNKKIKYACRKTLADSRPRIRGRFARNDEIEKNPQVQWSHIGGEEDEEDDDNWINFIDTFSANMVP